MRTIQFIRENKNFKKRDVYTGIMSKYSYDILENDIENALLHDFLKVLKKLNVSVEEYIYLQNQKKMVTIDDFIDEIKKINISSNKNKLISLIEKYKDIDHNIYNLLKSIYYMHTNEFKKARLFGEKIWNKLKDNDDYTPSETFLLSHIFYLFPLQQSEGIIKILLKKLTMYRSFKEYYKTEIIFYLNAGRYMVDIDYKKSKIFFEKALSLSINSENAKYTALSYIRLGDHINNTEYIEKGRYLLDIFDSELWEILKCDLKSFNK